MLSKRFEGVRISGLACAVPDNKLVADSYRERFGNAAVDKFVSVTGIKQRYSAKEGQTASDLCFVAADALMKKKGLTGDDIDALLFVTQTPDYYRPSTAFVLHKRLHLRLDCLAYDINLGCSAFIVGSYTIAGLIESGTVERALLLIGDAGTLIEATENDVSFNMMFGDAGAAILLERGESDISAMVRSDGEGFNQLITPVPGFRFPGVAMNSSAEFEKKMSGDDVFLFTITKIPKLFKEFYGTFGCTSEDFDYYVLHQANKMIVEHIAKKLKLPQEKVPMSLDKYGNTDGASIPVGIVDLCENIGSGKKLKIISSGFGIGLSWGVMSFEIDSSDVLPMIFTNDQYTEGKNI